MRFAPWNTLRGRTVGQRIFAGFILLLTLCVGIGSFAIFIMHTVTDNARALADSVAPQADLASDLAAKSATARFAAIRFAATGETEAKDATETALTEVAAALAEARTFSDAHPDLPHLREGLDAADAAFLAYEENFTKMVKTQRGLGDARRILDAQAAVLTENTNALIAKENAQLEALLSAGANPEAIREAHQKSVLATEMLEISNQIQKASFRSQAINDYTDARASLVLFDGIEERVDAIKETAVDPTKIAQLDAIRAACDEYFDGVRKLLGADMSIRKVTKQGDEAANQFDELVANILDASIAETNTYARQETASLAASIQTLLGGLAVAVVLGLATAYLISRSINRQLRTTADQLSDGSHQVASASTQVSSSSHSLAHGSSQQAASLEEISSSIEELTSMTQRNASNAESGSTAAIGARTAAETGAKEMGRMQEAMDAIQQSSQEISKIIKTIDEIAFQTNILALNAAVEAARAGEAGAGFAVVAEEVRSLAQRSALAAQETASKIADATERSSQGVAISVRVGEGLQTILERTREVDKLVAEVAQASKEQSDGLSQINSAIGDMDRVTQSNAAGAEETASAAEELNAQSAELQRVASTLARLVGAVHEEREPSSNSRQMSPSGGTEEDVFHDQKPSRDREAQASSRQYEDAFFG